MGLKLTQRENSRFSAFRWFGLIGSGFSLVLGFACGSPVDTLNTRGRHTLTKQPATSVHSHSINADPATPAPIASLSPAPIASPSPAPVAAPSPAPVASPSPAPSPSITPRAESPSAVPGDDLKTRAETLLPQLVGFAAGKTTGGRNGHLYHVVNLKDNGPGSLREGAESDQPLWIVFDVSGTIKLRKPIVISSNKTIDGRGQKIVISDKGFRLFDSSENNKPSENVIIENLIFQNGNKNNNPPEEDRYHFSGDAIEIKWEVRNIWVDHCSFSSYVDGMVDISRGSTNVTVSWSRFASHDKVMLIGHSAYDDDEPDKDEWIAKDKAVRVTVHHNFFDQTTQRHPRLRWGRVHAFNNYIYKWSSFGMSSVMDGQLYSESNIFEAGSSKNAIDSQTDTPGSGNDSKGGYVKSVGDLMIGGGRIQKREKSGFFRPSDSYSYTAAPANEALKTLLREKAGWQRYSFD